MEGFLEEALLKRVGSTHTRRVSKWRKRWVRLFRCDAGTFLLTHDKPPVRVLPQPHWMKVTMTNNGLTD